MTPVPACSHLDLAEQRILAYGSDRDIGPNTTALRPLTEHVRAAFEAAALADRIDQVRLTPHDDDDDYDRLAHWEPYRFRPRHPSR